MAILNICGFEAGFDEAGSEAVANTSTNTSIVTSPVRSGDYALRVNPTTSNIGSLTLSGVAATGIRTDFSSATTYIRFYFRYATKPVSGKEEILRVVATDSGVKARLYLDSNGNLVLANFLGTVVATGSTALSANTWYCIEVKCGTSTTTGAYEVRIGTDTGSTTTSEFSGTTNLHSANAARVLIGKAQNNDSNSIDFFYDDVCIRDDAFPGPGKVVRLDPTSKDTTTHGNTWTATGGSANFTNVADYSSSSANDGDTTYYVSNTNGQILVMEVEDSATLSISGTINCVKAVATARDESQTVAFQTGLYSGTDSLNSSADGPATYSLRARLTETDPNTGTAWTTTGLNSAKVEVAHAQAQARNLRVTAMALMVDFTPAAASTLSPPPFHRSQRFFRR